MDRVTMPQLGETVTEGTIVRWLKQIGDPVALDEPLFEVSTDKIDTEVPSAFAGVLLAVYAAEGDTVPIGALVAVIAASADEVLPVELAAAAPAATAPAVPAATAPAVPAPAPIVRAVAPVVEPAPRPAPPVSPGVRRGGSGYLSPVVQRLLGEHGLAPEEVVGSGRDGRITRADVLAAAANRAQRPPTPAAPRSVLPGPTESAQNLRPYALDEMWPEPGPDDEVIEFTRARRATAEHMVTSLRTSAHTLVVTEVDYSAVDAVRSLARLSYLPFVARAVVDAIADFPHVNASVGRDGLIVHPRVHLGVAVDVRFEALVVPVVRHADGMRLRALAEAIGDLAARARAKRLSADDLQGGTFSVTNVGPYGTVVTGPIINQPQVAILSTDGVRMRPVAVPTGTGSWAVAVRPVGNLSLSFDHRALDGAYAAAFLARVRDTLEQRDWSQEV